MVAAVVSAPLKEIDRMYAAAGCPRSPVSFGVPEFFAAEVAKDPAAIPLLTASNAHTLPNNSLVRLQATVQDLPNPQLYVGVARRKDGSLCTTKFSDAADDRIASLDTTALWDRQPVVVVPAPKSAWIDGRAAGAAAPVPSDVSDDAFLVYMYDGTNKELVLHDLVEVIGVLSRPPSADAVEGLSVRMEEACDVSGGGGGDQAGVQHAAHQHEQADAVMGGDALSFDHEGAAEAEAFGKMISVHALLVTRSPDLVSLPSRLPTAEKLAPLRARAVATLARALGGDVLAAEYVLLSAMQRVTARTADTAMGVAPLSLTHCPAPAPGAKSPGPLGPALRTALASLVPLTSSLDLTVEAANVGGWTPCRAPGAPRVSRSPLQLPPGCLLVVDETGLSEGTLLEAGTASMRALGGVLSEQLLRYEFEMYSHPVPVCLPAIVLSTGRSVLRESLQLQLPLHATREVPGEVEITEELRQQDAELKPVRVYLAGAAAGDYELSDDMRARLVDEFVAARKADATFGPEAFQTQLTLARASALSWGETTLTPQRWAAVKDMEATRSARLRVV
ncbi:hypothetical protein FOA52_006778 [Chlamydomonas sp. UWO 241]|nr:hypothetical protein FOA52_006778 [Chlamydomonas sp. UWO 241]